MALPRQRRTGSGCESLSRRRGGLRRRRCAPVLRSFARRSSVAGGRSRYARGRKAASRRSPLARSPVAPLPASPPPPRRSGSPSLRFAGAVASASPARGVPACRCGPPARVRGAAWRAPRLRLGVRRPRGALSRPFAAASPLRGLRSVAPPALVGLKGGPAVALRSASRRPCPLLRGVPASLRPRRSASVGAFGAWLSLSRSFSRFAGPPPLGRGVFRACGRGLPPAARPSAAADPRARG